MRVWQNAVVNAGLAETGIWRELPPQVRQSMLASRSQNTIAESAFLPTALCLADNWASPSYWGQVGVFEALPLQLDAQETERYLAVCRELTGA